MFDMLNGARLIGEVVVGFDSLAILRPMVLNVQKGETDTEVKLSLNRVLFVGDNSLYRIQASAVMATFQCFDATLHNMYEQTLTGEKPADDTNNE